LRAVGDKPRDDARRAALDALLKAYRAGEARPAADAKPSDPERKFLEEMLQRYEKLRGAEDEARKAAEVERLRAQEVEALRARDAEAAARAQADLQDALKKKAIEAADQLKRREAELKLTAAQQRAEAEEQRTRALALEAELQKTRALAEQLTKRLAELDAEKKKAGGVKPGADESRDTLSIALKHVSASEVSKVLQQVFPKAPAKVVVDERTNTLHATGPAETLADIKKLIGELDKPAVRK
jgi:type II secretory pathway component GspD/PulD (secretin)